MSVEGQAARRSVALAAPRADDPALPGRYVTDGSRLFRLVAPFDLAVRGSVVGLEDCHSLDVVVVPVEEFRRRALRAV